MKSKQVEFGFQAANQSPGFLLWQLQLVWQRKVKHELAKLNLTHTQFVLLAVLAWLSESAQKVTQTDIATHSKTDRMMVSKVLRTLESKGYIGRKGEAADTRVKLITLTDSGNQLLQIAVKTVEQVDATFFSTLNDEQAQFIRSMNILVANNE